MSRSYLRKKLKDQACDEVRQKEEFHKVIYDSSSERVRNFQFDGFHSVLRSIAKQDFVNKLERRKEAIENKLTDILEGRIPPNVTYKESDQSPVKGEKALLLSEELGTGFDYNPEFAHLSDWLRTLYRGDYEKFMYIIRDMPEDELKILLSKRETLFNVPAVFHPTVLIIRNATSVLTIFSIKSLSNLKPRDSFGICSS